jgi:DNA-binding MarR family transcriptional regulator
MSDPAAQATTSEPELWTAPDSDAPRDGTRLSQTGPKKVTIPTLQVLDLFLANPGRDDIFALELCRQTGLGSGTVTQILFRLEQWGWAESRWEDLVTAHGMGRPRRRFYRLTGAGDRAARELVKARFPGLLGWHVRGGLA